MEQFKIYIDRLRSGQKKEIEENFDPAFLDIQEADLQFPKPVAVQGETYIADDHLILHLNLETTAILPCSICNEPTPLPIAIKNLYLTIPLETVRGAIFDFSTELREAILLQIPLFAECGNGKCPQREQLKKYLTDTTKGAAGLPAHEVHFPFSEFPSLKKFSTDI